MTQMLERQSPWILCSLLNQTSVQLYDHMYNTVNTVRPCNTVDCHPDKEIRICTHTRSRGACEASAAQSTAATETVCHDWQDLYLEVTRADFEFQVEPLLQRCMDVVADVLAQAHFTAVSYSCTTFSTVRLSTVQLPF